MDSLYARNITMGIWMPNKENVELARELRTTRTNGVAPTRRSWRGAGARSTSITCVPFPSSLDMSCRVGDHPTYCTVLVHARSE